MPDEPIVKEPGSEGEVDKYTLDEWVGKFNDGNWREMMSNKELASDPTLAKYHTWEEQVKGHINLQKSAGNRVPRFNPEGTPEEQSEWYKNHMPGMVESSDKYELFRAEGDYPYDEDSEKFFRDLAFKNNLTAAQAKSMWKEAHMREFEKWQTANEAANQMREQDRAKLRKEWGAAFEEKIELARSVLKNFASDELRENLKKSGLNSEVWKFLANVGSNFSEDKLPKARPQTTLTPMEAVAKAKEYIQQNRDAYMNQEHPMHKEALAKVQEFYKLAYPQDKK